MARSETPSEYSRRAWGSRGSLDNDDMIQSRPDSYAPSSQTHHQVGENVFASMLTEASQGSEPALDSRISMLGPKTRHVTPAPWEPGGEDDIIAEQEEEDNQESETRSLFGGRGRQKKAKDPSSKPRIFPASFAPRASSSSRPSVDVSTPTSSSSGGRVLPTGRPGSIGTSQSMASDLPFPSHRYDRPPVASPKRMPRELVEHENPGSPSHPYANPKYAASVYDDQASINMPPSPASVYPPSVMFTPKSPSNSGHGSHTPTSAPPRDIPPLPVQNGMPQKMSPWQYTPGSPTFQLVSLEEAQALRARQRQMSLGAGATNEQQTPRSRTISGPNRKSMLPLEHPPAELNGDSSNPAGKTLKGRRSLMGLFTKAKEKGSGRSESPPPVPVLPNLPNRSTTTPVSPSPLSSHTEIPSIPTPVRHESAPQPKSVTPKRLPPPSLNVVVTSPQPRIDHPYRDEFAPPPAIPTIQKSATPPPSFPNSSSGRKPVPRKQTSAQTLSPTSPSNKPSSAPSTIQGFTGLSLRPVSTIFNSMPTDYLAQGPSVHPVPSMPYGSNSGHSMTQSPTTPSLWSSRSESVSTGSLDIQQPGTPGGLVHSMSSCSSLEGPGGATSLSLLQKQVYGGRDMWKTQISDLEAQVKALKAEIVELRKSPCPSCGHLGGGSSCAEKTSVINRPRAKTAVNNQRFGDGEY
ncbi:hypothetical protein FRC17_008442 [Serendipita sp. 399]|nr:hypothetical protein FRC17_008442 [Serendipita sp. 399]